MQNFKKVDDLLRLLIITANQEYKAHAENLQLRIDRTGVPVDENSNYRLSLSTDIYDKVDHPIVFETFAHTHVNGERTANNWLDIAFGRKTAKILSNSETLDTHVEMTVNLSDDLWELLLPNLREDILFYFYLTPLLEQVIMEYFDYPQKIAKAFEVFKKLRVEGIIKLDTGLVEHGTPKTYLSISDELAKHQRFSIDNRIAPVVLHDFLDQLI